MLSLSVADLIRYLGVSFYASYLRVNLLKHGAKAKHKFALHNNFYHGEFHKGTEAAKISFFILFFYLSFIGANFDSFWFYSCEWYVEKRI
jgi:hypothetical protein